MTSAEPSEQWDVREWGIAVFAAAITGSAFLIFLVQPMVAKRILPWFGGTPAVWMLCLAFYQSALFVGYAYAHALVRWAPPKAQILVHGAMLLGAIAALPILPAASWAAAAVEEPRRWILLVLLVEIALPFVALAATGPLVQAWFARRHPDRSPYPLYALSNIGSMLALFAFSFLIEPRWTLSMAGRTWGVSFVGVVVAVSVCGVMAARSAGGAVGRPRTGGPDTDPGVGEDAVGLWLLLSGAAVVVLMGVSNRLCLDIASIPFLWILPLSLYLLTFIVAFADAGGYRREVFLGLSLLALAVSVARGLFLLSVGLQRHHVLDSIYFEIALYSVLLCSICMVLHGELYRLRPPPIRLTKFYLSVSGGGALAGLFVGLLAPRIFSDYLELEIGLVLALVGIALAPRTRGDLHVEDVAKRPRSVRPHWVAVFAVALVGAQLAFAMEAPQGGIWRERSFFGVLQVLETGQGRNRRRSLRHGSTLHGVQYTLGPARGFPTSYYGRATPLGAWMSMRAPDEPMRIGVVGLGVGTVAAYGRAGDVLRFYEIDPAVAQVAGSGGYFSFLEDTPATVEIRLGDARRVLDDERANGRRQEFDLLILDAFSSDSIPAHLMTKEAFEGYRAALSDRGMIAVHASNRHLRLMPIASRLGRTIGFESLQLTTYSAPRYQSQAAEWVFLGPETGSLTRLERALSDLYKELRLRKRAYRVHVPSPAELEAIPLWTDDYTDVFGALKPL
jgi:spermidine synthase